MTPPSIPRRHNLLLQNSQITPPSNIGIILGSKIQQTTFSSFLTSGKDVDGGIEFAWENGWHRVVLESDSKQLVEVLTGHQQVPAELEI
ncbi:hypothetical protein LIER_35308 [Lithospermum erythrorhizon]|uniref:RNase H type-1 domain-containing protein n=1 Tax=Lithospermum erythrorhizon TaxID=34254 RepID=A0AAV3NPT5_LITER